MFCFEYVSTFFVADDSFGNMLQEIGRFSSFFCKSPTLSKDQPVVVQVGGSLRGKTNGRNFLSEFDGQFQRQDGDVIELFNTSQYIQVPSTARSVGLLSITHSPNLG